jgi:hypothetical protein
LTPFPGTELWEQEQDPFWARYTGQRAVMHVPHLSRTEVHLLFGLAYFSRDLRSWEAARGFYRFLRARRFVFEVLGRMVRHRLSDDVTLQSAGFPHVPVKTVSASGFRVRVASSRVR